MRRGRPNKGLEHIHSLVGGDREKRRLRLILATLAGQQTVAGASLGLRVSPARFAKLRTKALQGALDALAPRPVGRPPSVGEDREGEACKKLKRALERSEQKRRVLQDLLDQGLRGPTGSKPRRGGVKGSGRKTVSSR